MLRSRVISESVVVTLERMKEDEDWQDPKRHDVRALDMAHARYEERSSRGMQALAERCQGSADSADQKAQGEREIQVGAQTKARMRKQTHDSERAEHAMDDSELGVSREAKARQALAQRKQESASDQDDDGKAADLLEKWLDP